MQLAACLRLRSYPPVRMAHRSRNRGVLERRARRRRRLWPLVGLVVVVCGALLAVYSLRTSDADTAATSGAGTSQSSAAGTSGSSGGPATPAKQVLRVTRLTRLAAPVQDAAVTTVGSRAYAFGGLDASGVVDRHHLGVAGIVGAHRRATARADPRRGGRCLAGRAALRAGRRPVRERVWHRHLRPRQPRHPPGRGAAHAALRPGGGDRVRHHLRRRRLHRRTVVGSHLCRQRQSRARRRAVAPGAALRRRCGGCRGT